MKDDDLDRRVKESLLRVDRAIGDGLTFLFVGRTGAGKSSTVNSLMGHPIALVGHYAPTTASVAAYTQLVYGVPFTFIDTPGLCDGHSKNRDHLKLIRSAVKSFHLMVYVAQFDYPRVEEAEHRALRLIHEASGTNVWEHMLIVLTRGCSNTISEAYDEHLKNRAREIHGGVRKALRISAEAAERVPIVVVDNHHEFLPDKERTRWLPELYMSCINQIADEAVMQFFCATQPRLVIGRKRRKRRPRGGAACDEKGLPGTRDRQRQQNETFARLDAGSTQSGSDARSRNGFLDAQEGQSPQSSVRESGDQGVPRTIDLTLEQEKRLVERIKPFFEPILEDIGDHVGRLMAGPHGGAVGRSIGRTVGRALDWVRQRMKGKRT